MGSKATRFSASVVAAEVTQKFRDSKYPRGSLQLVPVSRIKLDPQQPRKLGLHRGNPTLVDASDPEAARKRIELAELQDLAKNIEAVGGLVEPIGIYPHGADFVLMWGERRLLATELLGETHIEARILPERPANLRAQQLAENMFRRGLSLSERIGGMRKMCEDSAAGVKDANGLAKVLGLASTTAYRYWAIMHAPEDVQRAIAAGVLTNAKDAERIAAITDPQERAKAIESGTKAEDGEDAGEGGAGANTSARPAGQPSLARGRGRVMESIHLGKTKSPNVAKYIVERVLDKSEYAQFADANWDDMKVASEILKTVIKRIEDKIGQESQPKAKK